jgi:hypothetical protein
MVHHMYSCACWQVGSVSTLPLPDAHPVVPRKHIESPGDGKKQRKSQSHRSGMSWAFSMYVQTGVSENYHHLLDVSTSEIKSCSTLDNFETTPSLIKRDTNNSPF